MQPTSFFTDNCKQSVEWMKPPFWGHSVNTSALTSMVLLLSVVGQRETEMVTSGSSQRSDGSTHAVRHNVTRGVGLISAQGGPGRWYQEQQNKLGDAPHFGNDVEDVESGSVDFYSLTNPNSDYYSVSVDEFAKNSQIQHHSDRYYNT